MNRVKSVLLRDINPIRESPEPGVKLFRAHRFWESNAAGAVVAGLGGGVILAAVGVLLLFYSASSRGILVGVFLITYTVLATLALYPGNYILKFPVAIEVGQRLRIIAPFKELCVDWDEVEDAYVSPYYSSAAIELRRRRGLIRLISFPYWFCAQADPLVEAIQEKLQRKKEQPL